MIQVKQKTGETIIRKDNVRPFTTPAQKRQMKILIGVIALIVVIGLAAYFWIVPKDKVYALTDYSTSVVRKADLTQTTQASGAVAVPAQISVLSPETAYAGRLYVTEGDKVRKGQLMVSLSTSDLENEIDDLRTTLLNSKRDLLKAQTQNKYTIAKMERDLVLLDKQIADAGEEVVKAKELVAINASRQSDLDAKQTALDDLENKKVDSDMNLAQEKDLEKLDIDTRNATIDQTETKIGRLLERNTALSVKAPMSGDILSMEKSLAVPGSSIAQNAVLFTIADPTSAEVELEILEDYASLLKVGQEIVLTISGSETKGKITNIGKVATASSDGLGATVQVKVKPLNQNNTLLLGSTAVGTIELGKKAQILLLPRGPYLTTGNQKYLYKVTGDTATKIEVTFGVIQGNDVEVVKGVAEGDVIVTSGYENYINFQNISLKKGN
jgi:HlyD family secretion protein